MRGKDPAPTQRDLTRRDLGLVAATALAVGVLRPGSARAVDSVDRSDTLIVEAWPAGTTFKNFNNMNLERSLSSFDSRRDVEITLKLSRKKSDK